jgi:alanine-synthesizing transaminase
MLERLAEAIEKNRPRILLLNFPNNPTGLGVSDGFWKKLLELSRSFRCILLNDFVYGELGFSDVRPISLLSACEANKENCLEVYSLSKAYSIPGWRIAALVGDRNLVQDFSKLKSKVDYGIFLPLQLAAAQSLVSDGAEVERIRRIYASRAQVLAQGLQKLGCELTLPDAGACLWVRLPEDICRCCEEQGKQFTSELLHGEGIHILPGMIFGDDYREFVRMALVRPETDLQNVLHGFEKIFLHLRGKKGKS